MCAWRDVDRGDLILAGYRTRRTARARARALSMRLSLRWTYCLILTAMTLVSVEGVVEEARNPSQILATKSLGAF